jgi:hypothetical protein
VYVVDALNIIKTEQKKGGLGKVSLAIAKA